MTTDDGDSGYTTGYGSVLSLDPKTGVLLDQLKATNVGDLRSSVCYDPATDAITSPPRAATCIRSAPTRTAPS